MDRPYITELRIQNYGCIRDATFKLTPLHALIGPNDSGKSTALRALATLGFDLTASNGLAYEDRRRALMRALLASTKAGGASFALKASDHASWVIASPTPGHNPATALFEGRLVAAHRPPSIERSLRGMQLLRLDPDALRQPHALIQDGQPLRFLDERGTGLPALYDALIVRNLPAYATLNQELTRLFPSVASIQMTTPQPTLRGMGVRLTDGTFVPAELMSEGLLYYLAFAILPHLEPTALLLVEEPENGLHPARIAEVMRALRAISEKTQVIIATHSPLVVNELRPEEVTVVTRTREEGTKATPLKSTPDFEERSKVYALGELWLSYANGEDEGPLLQGGPRP